MHAKIFCKQPIHIRYDDYSGYLAGERCSSRDLIHDLYEALDEYGIKLMLYSSALAPNMDEQAGKGLGCLEKSDISTGVVDWIITDTFKERWSEVLGEYAKRYGNKVSGWWIDGCYEQVRFTNEIARVYSQALKAGNQNSIIAFNPGHEQLKRKRTSDYDDYTAGEFNDLLAPQCLNRWTDGIQWHELSFLCENWGNGEINYSEKQIIDHISNLSAHGGVLTIDIPLNEPYIGDRIRPDVLKLLQNVKAAITITSE